MKPPLTPGEVTALYANVMPDMAKRGKEWRAPCPLHKGKNPSFAVNPENGEWTCHSKCGCGGTAIDLYMKLHGMDFNAAAAEVEKIVGRPPRSKNVATYDYTDVGGKLLYQVVRKDPKKFLQRRPDGAGGFIWKMGGVTRVLYRLPRVAGAAQVLVVEGEKDVHSLEELGFTATCNSGGAGKWRSEFGDALAGKYVVVLPDNDDVGQKHAEDVVRSLQGKAAEIRVVTIPVGKDVSDWITAGATKEAIDTAIIATRATTQAVSSDKKEGTSAGLPEIYVTDRQLRELRAEGLAALVRANTPPRTFVRGNSLVDIRPTDNGRYLINNLTDVQVRGQLSDVASFYAETDAGRKSCAPPLHLAKDILGHRDVVSRFPGLVAITEIPVLRPDGTVLESAGYDAATRLYYNPAPDLIVPSISEQPTMEDVQRALHVIDSAIGEFPYVFDLDQKLRPLPFDHCDGPDAIFSASKANAVGLMLTSVVRPAIIGPTPLAVVTAPAAGTGKTLFAEVVSKIATGREAALFSAPGDEEEWRKQITSYLKEGVSVIVIDNVSDPLTSGQLSKALTAGMWADRILGHSQTVLLPVRCTWIATGNNIRVGGDLPRRCYLMKLDAKTSRPHLRSDFTHPNLRRWIGENRGQLIGALLTIARYWFASGKPQLNPVVLGSYESWAEVIGGILGHSGIPGFLGNAGEFQDQADDDAERQTEIETRFLKVLLDAVGGKRFSSADVHQLCLQDPTAEDLAPALPPELSDELRDETDFVRRMGRWLGERADRRNTDAPVRVERAGLMHKSQLWVVVRTDVPESGSIQ